MSLCRVLKPLDTRNKNRITQSTEKTIFKNYHILHKLHNHKIHKWIFQSLLPTDYYQKVRHPFCSRYLWCWPSLISAMGVADNSVQSRLNLQASILSHAYLFTFCPKASRNTGVNIPKGKSHPMGMTVGK